MALAQWRRQDLQVGGRGQIYRFWRARKREPIGGSGGSAPSGVQRQSPGQEV